MHVAVLQKTWAQPSGPGPLFLCDPSMSSHNDIIAQAMSLVVAHGEDAPIQAAKRAQALLDRGDRAGYALWRRIGSMSNVLLSHAAAADVGVP